MISIYDAIRERENQVAVFQAQIAGLQAEVDALRVAARILDGPSGNGSSTQVEVPRPLSVHSVQPAQSVPAMQATQSVQPVAAVQQATATIGMEKKRVWP